MSFWVPAGVVSIGTRTNNAQVHRVAVDPSSVGVVAPLGSLALNNVSGLVYRKYGAANTDWELLGATRYVPNEMWMQNDVAASQTNVGLQVNVSQLFDTWRAPRAGSIVGLVSRFSEAITAGSVSLRARINGAPSATLVATSVGGTGTQVTQAAGIDTYAAGDLLDIAITTNAGFLPISTDVEAYMEVQE